MPLTKLNRALAEEIRNLESQGRKKPSERVIVAVKKPALDRGPRFYLYGAGSKGFICMNSNSYLGLGLCNELIRGEETAGRKFGVGPGAVRFISGTFRPHVDLENRLADFHDRDAAIIMGSAYSASLGVLSQLITESTLIISDELNHNCIINAMRLARPIGKMIYPHNNTADLEKKLNEAIEQPRVKRVIIVTDGIFSMRGDCAPLAKIKFLSEEYGTCFPEGVITVMDDSHGVGAFGKTGRGTEEHTGARADILVGTLGKAFGVNGGYAAASEEVIEYLRNTAPTYIFSNPISPGEAAAALKAIDIVDSSFGRELLAGLREKTKLFREGLKDAGFETLEGEHPVVPLLTRNTDSTRRITEHLFERGILSSPIVYPVVPKGEEEIRFQVSAAHTEKDLRMVLKALRSFKRQ